LYFQERRSSELDLYPCEAKGAHSCGHPKGSSHHEGRGQHSSAAVPRRMQELTETIIPRNPRNCRAPCSFSTRRR